MAEAVTAGAIQYHGLTTETADLAFELYFQALGIIGRNQMGIGANRYRQVTVAAVAAGAFLATAGCSVQASIGSGGAMVKSSVETNVASTVAKRLKELAPKVSCPGDLKAKTGTVMTCTLTPPGSATSYPVKVQVTSTDGGKVHFSVHVSKTPGHFTS